MLTKICDGWWIDLSKIVSLCIDYEGGDANWSIEGVTYSSQNMEAMKKLEKALEAFYGVG
jgi:hypothetical protein